MIVNEPIDDFKKWLESSGKSYLDRKVVLEFLKDYPGEEWVIGMRVICSIPGLPVIYISYLIEKLDLLERPGAWTRVFDAQSRSEFLRLQREIKS